MRDGGGGGGEGTGGGALKSLLNQKVNWKSGEFRLPADGDRGGGVGGRREVEVEVGGEWRRRRKCEWRCGA